MLPYNPKENYFGAENTKLAVLFGEILKFMPALKEGWNYAAYRHDVAYFGKKKTGFWSFIGNFRNRRKADRAFRRDLIEVIIIAEDSFEISSSKADRALKLAGFAYKAVRVMGWKFYRTE